MLKWRVNLSLYRLDQEKRTSHPRDFYKTKRRCLKTSYCWRKKEAVDMTFESFCEIYVEDIQNQIRDNTWGTKTNIYPELKFLPWLPENVNQENWAQGHYCMAEWTACDPISQMENRNSASYLQKIHSQLVLFFNHAVNFYHLPSNPAQKAGNMGKERAPGNVDFLDKEEYLKFTDAMMDKPVSYYTFEILYWCGIRMGELMLFTHSISTLKHLPTTD